VEYISVFKIISIFLYLLNNKDQIGLNNADNTNEQTMQTIQTNKVYNTIQAKNTIQTNKEYNTKEYNEEIIQYNTNKEYNTNGQKTLQYKEYNTIQKNTILTNKEYNTILTENITIQRI